MAEISHSIFAKTTAFSVPEDVSSSAVVSSILLLETFYLPIVAENIVWGGLFFEHMARRKNKLSC